MTTAVLFLFERNGNTQEMRYSFLFLLTTDSSCMPALVLYCDILNHSGEVNIWSLTWLFQMLLLTMQLFSCKQDQVLWLLIECKSTIHSSVFFISSSYLCLRSTFFVYGSSSNGKKSGAHGLILAHLIPRWTSYIWL